MRALIIVPTYNESENIEPLVREILARTPPEAEILIVDDSSPDGTGQIAEQLAAQVKRVHVLHRSSKEGLGPAYIAGFRWGLERGFEALIEMDADFSHQPKYLPAMLEGLKSYDVVLGSRYVAGGGTRNWGLGRRLLSRGGSIYSRLILAAPIQDFTGGFNGWRSAVLQSMDLNSLRSDGYSFQIELKYRAHLLGYRIHEFPIIFEDRKVGRSKMSKRIVLEALYRVWTFRFSTRKSRSGFAAITLKALVALSLVPSLSAWGSVRVPSLILVDKKTTTLEVAEYAEPEFRVLKSYHATVGKVMGDKEIEGDLKTPEGIYFLTTRLAPPTTKPKLGKRAFMMNYPNPFDRLSGKAGFDIMLHATNDPSRLKKDFDSEGCIVVSDEEISEIEPKIQLGITPILVFSELTADYRQPASDPRLKPFFESWVKAWEEKDIDRYIDHYYSKFASSGMDRARWKQYKDSLNRKYDQIEVGAEQAEFFRHPKYSVILFNQNYKSTSRGGVTAFSSSGTKILYLAEESGQLKIISEDFTRSKW